MKVKDWDAYKYYKQAETLLGIGGMTEPVLMTVRNALESFTKQCCKICGIGYDSRDTDLSAMIDSLFDSGFINNSLRDLMHRTRQLCNKGAHVDESVDPSDGQSAFLYLGEIFEKAESSIREDTAQSINHNNNVPMDNPDYYSVNRRYYGMWSHCYDRNSLLVIPEYIDLEEKALAGDVQACLDIAIGFLPKNRERNSGISWNEDKLIVAPPFFYKGRAYYQDDTALDARYYLWVTVAVVLAGDHIINSKEIPMKYIATAIWDAYLHALSVHTTKLRYNCIMGVNDYTGEFFYADLYNCAINMLFPDEIFREKGNAYLIQNLFSMFFLYDEVDAVTDYVFSGKDRTKIVAAIHEDAKSLPLLKLRFMKIIDLALMNAQRDVIGAPAQLIVNSDVERINMDYQAIQYYTGQSYNKLSIGEKYYSWEVVEPYLFQPFFINMYNRVKSFSDSECAEVLESRGINLNTAEKEEHYSNSEKKKGLFSKLLGL